jgi:ribosome maturation factor RimP
MSIFIVRMDWIKFLFLLMASGWKRGNSWRLTSQSSNLSKIRPRSGTITPGILLYATLPKGYEEVGTRLIQEAGRQCGITDDNRLKAEWKAGRIIVTVYGDSYVSDPVDSDADFEEGDDYIDIDDREMEHLEVAVNAVASPPPGAVDVTQLTRAINAAFDADEVGLAIAEAHEVEVTTPGASDELSGIMFQSYRGFDVIVQHMDKNTKKQKIIEGRLHERNDEFTVINIKGRMKNLKNQDIISVKLPKAKREKGSQ